MLTANSSSRVVNFGSGATDANTTPSSVVPIPSIPAPGQIGKPLPDPQSAGGPDSGDFGPNSLTEPISETILRDLNSIKNKLQYVLLPKARKESGGILKKWDLWGPLILCLLLSIVLWGQAVDSQKKVVFGLVFVVFWVGSGVVTINASLLGSHVAFFQSVCVLGYCLFPLVLASLICLVIPRFVSFLKLAILGVALYWSTGASASFLGGVVPVDRKALAVYPVWLFYANLAWMILVM